MGVAIAGLAISAGSAIYGASQQSKAANAAAGRFADLPNWAPYVDPVEFDRLKLRDPWGVFSDYFQRAPGMLKQAESFAGKSNDAYQRQLERTTPGILAGAASLSRYGNELLDGRISSDAATALSRSSAFRALQAGFGGGTENANALTARDLGLTVEQQKTKGAALLPGTIQISQALNPVRVNDLMLSPQQLLARMDQMDIANWQVGNQEKAFNTSLDLENQNAQYQARLAGAGIAAQNDMAQGAARAQMASSIGSAVGGAMSGFSGIGGGGSFGGGGGVDWTKIGGFLGLGSGQYAQGGYSSPGTLGTAAPYAGGQSFVPGTGWVPRAAAI